MTRFTVAVIVISCLGSNKLAEYIEERPLHLCGEEARDETEGSDEKAGVVVILVITV